MAVKWAALLLKMLQIWAGLNDGLSQKQRTIGGQSADNRDFTVCIIRCVYRAELMLGT